MWCILLFQCSKCEVKFRIFMISETSERNRIEVVRYVCPLFPKQGVFRRGYGKSILVPRRNELYVDLHLSLLYYINSGLSMLMKSSPS